MSSPVLHRAADRSRGFREGVPRCGGGRGVRRGKDGGGRQDHQIPGQLRAGQGIPGGGEDPHVHWQAPEHRQPAGGLHGRLRQERQGYSNDDTPCYDY